MKRGCTRETNYVVVDSATCGINVTINMCAADSTITCGSAIRTHLCDVLLCGFGNLIPVTKDNSRNCRHGPSVCECYVPTIWV